MIHTITLDDETMRGKVGDTFMHRNGKQAYPATITGYHVEYDTDTQETFIAYCAVHHHLGSPVSFTAPRSVVDRQLIARDLAGKDT